MLSEQKHQKSTEHSASIIFFGTDSFSLIILKRLHEAGYNIDAVVTKPDTKSGRGQKMLPTTIKSYAVKNNIPVWQPSKISDINGKILQLNSNVVGVLASFGKIIPKTTIELFNHGIINIHPSLLPSYRGPTPIETAIANGDKETGVTIMKLAPEMDAGPIYIQKKYTLSSKETSPDLYKNLAVIGADLLVMCLPKIINNSILPKPQPNNNVTYCSLLKKEDAWIDFSKITSEKAGRLIRAHLIFPKTKVIIENYQITITKAHISKDRKTALDIECLDKNYLIIDELIISNGKKMTSKEFLNGHKLT